MNASKRGRVVVLTMLAGTAFSLQLGCALIRKDLLQTGEAVIQPVPSEYVQFSRISVYREQGDLVVYGKIGRRAGVSGPLSGTVLAEALDNQGSTLLAASVSTFPERIPIRRSRHSHFVVRIRETQGVPVLIRVQYVTERRG